jgi:hypothetical protein
VCERERERERERDIDNLKIFLFDKISICFAQKKLGLMVATFAIVLWVFEFTCSICEPHPQKEMWVLTGALKPVRRSSRKLGTYGCPVFVLPVRLICTIVAK